MRTGNCLGTAWAQWCVLWISNALAPVQRIYPYLLRPGLMEIFMLCETKTALKEEDLMNIQSKASWNKNKASEMLKFVHFTEKSL